MLLLCAVGAALALLAASRGWVTVSVSRGSPLPPVHESGRTVEPLVPALGVVGLAGVAGLLATRRTGRLLLGALLGLAGLVVVARALPHLAAPSPERATELLDAHGRSVGVRSGSPAIAVSHPAWPLLAAAGGVVLAAGGVITVLRHRRWPGMSSRYDAPAARPTHGGTAGDTASRTDGAANGGGAAGATAASASSQHLWDAIDRGEDPTSG